MGASILITGDCSGSASEFALVVRIVPIAAEKDALGAASSIPPERGRILEVIDHAALVALVRLIPETSPPDWKPLCKSASALEYLARGVNSARADRPSEAVNYSLESLELDQPF